MMAIIENPRSRSLKIPSLSAPPTLLTRNAGEAARVPTGWAPETESPCPPAPQAARPTDPHERVRSWPAAPWLRSNRGASTPASGAGTPHRAPRRCQNDTEPPGVPNQDRAPGERDPGSGERGPQCHAQHRGGPARTRGRWRPHRQRRSPAACMRSMYALACARVNSPPHTATTYSVGGFPNRSEPTARGPSGSEPGGSGPGRRSRRQLADSTAPSLAWRRETPQSRVTGFGG